MQQFAIGPVAPVIHPEGAPWYDDKASITLALRDLESFHDLLSARRNAGYQQKQRLNEFYVFGGRWHLDTCGNVMRAVEDPLPEDLRVLTPVATRDEFRAIQKLAFARQLVTTVSISFGMKGEIPPAHILCAHCKKQWNIQRVYDAVTHHSTEVHPLTAFVGETLGEVERAYAERRDACYGMQSNILIRNDKYIDLSPKYPEAKTDWEKRVVVSQKGWRSADDGVTDDQIIETGDEGFFNRTQYFHTACRKADVTARTRKQFEEILQDAGYPKLALMEYPNEYGSESYRGPWFHFIYKDEFIRIGWRKRVIEIDWSRVTSKQLRSTIAEKFADVESTHTETIVHAYQPEVAAKFLADIRECLRINSRNDDT